MLYNRMHCSELNTVTELTCYALAQLLGASITQQGFNQILRN